MKQGIDCHLKSRVSEHQRAIKFQRPEKSAFCEHSISLNHTINWSDVEILKTETDYSKRLFAESWFINEKPEVMNRNDGHAFPLVNKKLLKSYFFFLLFDSFISNFQFPHSNCDSTLISFFISGDLMHYLSILQYPYRYFDAVCYFDVIFFFIGQ